jgi:pyruvate dehydrogenase E1 component alpha subunit
MTAVLVPQLSLSMEEATVRRWLVADGDVVAAGQPVVEVETDKATVEIEAPAAGALRIVAEVGAVVPVDGVLAQLEAAVTPAPAAGSTDGGAGSPSTPSADGTSAPHVGLDAPVQRPDGPRTTIAPVPVDEVVPGPRPDVSDDSLLALHREMVRVRAFEEEVIDAFGKGLIPGSTHPCIGAEAIKAGALSTLEADDLVFATYRGHGEALIKGVEPVSMMAELMGRATGVCKGKGGSMHLSDPAVGLVSTNAIVAGHIPMAGGAALSCQFRRTGQVVLCFFGDGASCEGEFFEAMNMAMLWSVPLVFVCENNGIAISVPTSKSQATPDIADRARGFGMPASIVDGNDVLAVRAAVAQGVARARAGDGPTFVECKTVRWERHSAFSAGGSDPVEQRRAWQRVDPIARSRKVLVAWGIATDAGLDELDSASRADARAIREEAERAPFPEPESIYEDIFAP